MLVTPVQFLDKIVVPNVAALGDDVGDVRLAVNAILTLDSFVGVLHADLYARGLEPNDDDVVFRNGLVSRHPEYGIVRDAAFALKHGELRHPKPRLVQRAKQVTSYSAAFDEAVWDRSAFDTEAVIWIEANDPANSRRADDITRAVLSLFRGMV